MKPVNIMDSIVFTKVLTHLAYPASIIGICFILSCVFLIFGKKIRSAFSIALGVVVYLLASNPHVSAHLVSQLEFRYPQLTLAQTPKADAIVVLGGSIRPPTFPRQYTQLSSTSDRFWHAARLYKAGKSEKIILIGGNVYKQENIKPESVYIKETLTRLGIPESAIITEDKSRTTKQNMEYAKELFEEHQVSSLLLVTSALHMPRTIREFQSLSVDITPISSDTIISAEVKPSIFNWIPNANAFAYSTRALHEYYGMAVQQGTKSAGNLMNYLKRPAQQTASL